MDYAAQQAWLIPGTDEQPWDLDRNKTFDLADLYLLTEDWLKLATWFK